MFLQHYVGTNSRSTKITSAKTPDAKDVTELQLYEEN
jgi:hypothetical protein